MSRVRFRTGRSYDRDTYFQMVLSRGWDYESAKRRVVYFHIRAGKRFFVVEVDV